MKTRELADPANDWDDLSTMKALTCRNHPTAQYLTKNPWTRGLHFIRGAEEFPRHVECPCPFSDLVVVVKED